jgi:hypothetical protein
MKTHLTKPALNHSKTKNNIKTKRKGKKMHFELNPENENKLKR